MYTQPGDVGSHRPAVAAVKKRQPPKRLFQLSQNGSFLHRPLSTASNTFRLLVVRTYTNAPAMKHKEPTSAAPHAISLFSQSGQSANSSRGSMQDTLNTNAPTK